MSPIMVLHEEGKFHILWLNTATARYEVIKTLDTYQDFVNYCCNYIRSTSSEMNVILSNIQVLSYAVQKFMPKPDIPRVFIDAFEDKRCH